MEPDYARLTECLKKMEPIKDKISQMRTQYGNIWEKTDHGVQDTFMNLNIELNGLVDEISEITDQAAYQFPKQGRFDR